VTVERERSHEKDVHARRTPQEMICPVCGGTLTEQNLPNAECVFKEGIFYCSKDRIISSHVLIEHQFTHFYNEEEDNVMDEPHELVAVIACEFDDSRECTAFTVIRVYPAPQVQ
jgi:hypothetical protein